MRQIIAGIVAAVLMAPSFAADMATPKEAKAMSEKARSAVNKMGSEEAFEAFADPGGRFQKKDLYVFCMDMDGVMLSHAVKPQLAGKNLLDFNKYGDPLFQEMIAVAKESGEGWVDYKWPHPGSDEIRQKTSYIATNDEGFFCGVGAYK